MRASERVRSTLQAALGRVGAKGGLGEPTRAASSTSAIRCPSLLLGSVQVPCTTLFQ